eukprot:1364863-Rhodomonas_salina.1
MVLCGTAVLRYCGTAPIACAKSSTAKSYEGTRSSGAISQSGWWLDNGMKSWYSKDGMRLHEAAGQRCVTNSFSSSCDTCYDSTRRHC